MKKIILTAVTVAAAAASMNAQAVTAAVCAGQPSPQQVTSIASAASSFIKTGFMPKCSANVILYYDDQTTFMRVGSASVKGKNAFGGSTMGGAVSANASCQATGCTATDVSNAVSSAAST